MASQTEPDFLVLRRDLWEMWGRMQRWGFSYQPKINHDGMVVYSLELLIGECPEPTVKLVRHWDHASLFMPVAQLDFNDLANFLAPQRPERPS